MDYDLVTPILYAAAFCVCVALVIGVAIGWAVWA